MGILATNNSRLLRPSTELLRKVESELLYGASYIGEVPYAVPAGEDAAANPLRPLSYALDLGGMNANLSWGHAKSNHQVLGSRLVSLPPCCVL